MTERLQKFLAKAGIASRRACEELIKQGKIKVNGKIIASLGFKIDPDKEIVEFNGKMVSPAREKIYIKFNKPAGYITSCKNTEGPTIFEFFKNFKERIYPIGRLDKESSGLLLLTNDGDVALKLSHPRYEHEKEYECETLYPLTKDQIRAISSGVTFNNKEKTMPAKVVQTGAKSFNIVLKEGKNRQIRRMASAVGNKIIKLKRTRYAKIKLGNLKEGKWERLSTSELQGLA